MFFTCVCIESNIRLGQTPLNNNDYQGSHSVTKQYILYQKRVQEENLSQCLGYKIYFEDTFLHFATDGGGLLT